MSEVKPIQDLPFTSTACKLFGAFVALLAFVFYAQGSWIYTLLIAVISIGPIFFGPKERLQGVSFMTTMDSEFGLPLERRVQRAQSPNSHSPGAPHRDHGEPGPYHGEEG